MIRRSAWQFRICRDASRPATLSMTLSPTFERPLPCGSRTHSIAGPRSLLRPGLMRTDPQWAGWVVGVVEVDPALFDSSAERVNITLPRKVLAARVTCRF
jgi:HicB_like antitoxin of bacterial toxin-antitoxin system